MKRSEAIKFLEGFLMALDGTLEPMPYNEKASSIIKFIEEALLMLPPKRLPTPKELYMSDGDDNYETAALFTNHYEWEPEDES